MRRLILALLTLTAAALTAEPGIADARAQSAAASSPLPVDFTITRGGRFIPRSFFGISAEYDQLATYENEGAVFDRALSLMRPVDGSRLVLRLGGKSADHTFWQTAPPHYPRHVIKLRPNWMSQLAALVRHDGLRVMLDLNLAVHSPTLEATFARAAVRALPRARLVGLEIGNEPDLYWRQPWLTKSRVATTSASTSRHWTVNYSPGSYRRDYSSYARVLRSKLRAVPLGGPEIISNKAPWLDSIAGLGRLDPGFITIHRYASSNCWPKTSPWWPTIPLMLNESSSAGLANSVRTAVTFAHSRREALRLTEVNSISCGGNPGVADAFATALWTPDALFEMIRAGVDSVSWHIRPGQLNAPWIVTNRGIQPMPELYGLAAFAQMIRPGAELLNSNLFSSLHVKGWAVQTPQGLRVLVINKGARAADVTLHLGTGSRTARLKALRAPGIGARTGIMLGGQSIGPDARWHGRQNIPTLHATNGEYQFSMTGYSAALVNVPR